MWRCLWSVLYVAFALTVQASGAEAGRRVALLIGNADYKGAPLANPVNDVTAMKGLLTKAGFDIVDARMNLDRSGMLKALRSFEHGVQGADIGVIFYSGHGIEFNGQNYLVPTDAGLLSDQDVEDETINLDRVLRALDGAVKLKLVLLDACRENPFIDNMKRIVTRGSASRGLARSEASTANMLIAYAAAPGHVALDGDGLDSPFTTALLKHLVTPGLDVELALRRVRDDVIASTNQQQVPFKTGSLGGSEIMLGQPAPAATPPVPAATVDPDANARADFSLAKSTGTLAAWDAFLVKYPSGFFADLARAERQKYVAVAVPERLPVNRASRPAAKPPVVTTPAPHSRRPVVHAPRIVIAPPVRRVTRQVAKTSGKPRCFLFNGSRVCE